MLATGDPSRPEPHTQPAPLHDSTGWGEAPLDLMVAIPCLAVPQLGTRPAPDQVDQPRLRREVGPIMSEGERLDQINRLLDNHDLPVTPRLIALLYRAIQRGGAGTSSKITT